MTFTPTRCLMHVRISSFGAPRIIIRIFLWQRKQVPGLIFSARLQAPGRAGLQTTASIDQLSLYFSTGPYAEHVLILILFQWLSVRDSANRKTFEVGNSIDSGTLLRS